MTSTKVHGSSASASSLPDGTGAQGAALAEAAAYLREEADFNRSWTDGRRGDLASATDEYIARRIELAEQRERWADAIDRAALKGSE